MGLASVEIWSLIDSLIGPRTLSNPRAWIHITYLGAGLALAATWGQSTVP